MKHSKLIVPLVLALLLSWGSNAYSQSATTSKIITYQGQIQSSVGIPLTGNYKAIVTFYTKSDGSGKFWQGVYDIAPVNGLFTIPLGANDNPLPEQMDHPTYVGISINGGEELRPLTLMSGAPYALTVPDNSITKSKLDLDYVSGVSVNGKKISTQGQVLNFVDGNGISLVYDEATKSISLNTSGISDSKKQVHVAPFDYWGEGGNNLMAGGEFIGSVNAVGQAQTAVEIRVDDTGPSLDAGRVMYYDIGAGAAATASPNITGGFNANAIAAGQNGSTIAGGGSNGQLNTIGSDFGVISGGSNNTIGAISDFNTIGGGNSNGTTGNFSSVGGGSGNNVFGFASHATISGGSLNKEYYDGDAIGGGFDNTIGSAPPTNPSMYSTIAGGWQGNIQAHYGSIAGGFANQISNAGQAGFAVGDNNRVQSWAQTVIGTSNRAQGATTPNTAPAGNDDRIFIIGNGQNGGARSNAFEVSYDGHSIVYDNNGTAGRTPIYGARYVDNTPYAWAEYDATAGAIANGGTRQFGVFSAVTTAVGVYTILLDTKDPVTGNQVFLSDASMVATISNAGQVCYFISVVGPTLDAATGRTKFVVNTMQPGLLLAPPRLQCNPVESNFMFVVLGRQ